jgi:hypothetical protein
MGGIKIDHRRILSRSLKPCVHMQMTIPLGRLLSDIPYIVENFEN